MKCQILFFLFFFFFFGKNKKNIINFSSAENAQRVVKVKYLFVVFMRLYICKVLFSLKNDF